ncbi:MAG: hypothetical protein B7Z83_05065 [Thiomonas sp. 20-64-5]|nr:MAG: hypothetical protein B7Z83_05065 [Thiomonas sp. 20-64-5]
MTRYHYEIVPRPADLGGGWRLRLLEDEREVGGGVFPLAEYAIENADEAVLFAYEDALADASTWLDSRPKEAAAAMAHMLTCSGIDYAPGALRVQDVRIEDIAHALSLICRFGGHSAEHYSVAQHSLLVVRILEAMEAPPEALLCGLLHDAHEAYVGDVPTPIKAMLGTSWNDLEHQAESAVLDAFGLRNSMNDWHDLVKHADRVALATERRDLLIFDMKTNLPWPILHGVEPFPQQTAGAWGDCRHWAEAFLERFARLQEACEARTCIST